MFFPDSFGEPTVVTRLIFGLTTVVRKFVRLVSPKMLILGRIFEPLPIEGSRVSCPGENWPGENFSVGDKFVELIVS